MSSNVVIIKYRAGNVQSVYFALQRLGIDATITDDINIIQAATKVILPGVGHAGSAMQDLVQAGLSTVIPKLQQPTLGICVGMQLMCKNSTEGNTTCMGIFENEVKLFEGAGLKVPQVGWNNIFDTSSALFKGIEQQSFIYNVHGYYAGLGQHTIATCNYGIDYSAALQKDNFYALQFHPEKSGKIGAQILKNFIDL